MTTDDETDSRDALNLDRAEVRRRSLTGVFYMTSSGFANLVIGFLGTLFVARMLTPSDFGVVAVGATVTMLGGAVADGGLGSGMIRRAEPPTVAELRTLTGIQLVIALAIALPVAAIGLGLGGVGSITAVMVLSLPIGIMQTPGRLMLARTMQFDRQALVDTGSQVGFQTFSVASVALGAGVWGIAVATVVRALLGTVLTSALAFTLPFPSLRGWRKFGEVMRFGVRFQANWLAIVGREQGLNAVVAIVSGVQTLGLWTLANRLLQVPQLAFMSLYTVSFPAMSNLLARGEDVQPILVRTVRRASIIATLAFPALAASSPALVPSLFGHQWTDAALIMPFICLSTLMLGSIAVAASGYLNARGEPGAVLRASASMGVIWIALTAVLLPLVGVVAIGVANVVGCTVEGLLLHRATARSAGVGLVQPLLRPLSVALVAGTLGWFTCTTAGVSLVAAVGAAGLTVLLCVIGLSMVCRRDFADTVALLRSTLRSVRAGPAAED